MNTLNRLLSSKSSLRRSFGSVLAFLYRLAVEGPKEPGTPPVPGMEKGTRLEMSICKAFIATLSLAWRGKGSSICLHSSLCGVLQSCFLLTCTPFGVQGSTLFSGGRGNDVRKQKCLTSSWPVMALLSTQRALNIYIYIYIYIVHLRATKREE